MMMTSQAFSVVTKPIGPKCNLDCSYCFYLEKERLYPGSHGFRMRDEVLETYIRDYIACQPGPDITFIWQGGEPTLLGIDFFRKAVALQKRYCPPDKTVRNAFQTNGTLIDQDWCRFFRENDFLVGLSIDGPPHLHDRCRRDKKGRPTGRAVRNALRLLRREGVAFNTLTVVHRGNEDQGDRIYRFLRSEGVRFMQFIPLVEAASATGPSRVTAESVSEIGFGKFLTDVFDVWIRRDVGKVSVQMFDLHFGLWAGMPSALCIHAPECGPAPALEHNGDLYACDHYVEPGHHIGNILETSLADLATGPRLREFGREKRTGLTRTCRNCEFLALCNGGCPKHRVAQSPEGEEGHNYLCPSYRRYLRHIAPAMQAMVALWRDGRPPAQVIPRSDDSDA